MKLTKKERRLEELADEVTIDWSRFTSRDVTVDHPAMQVALPLVSDHDGDLRCIGTAFAVAPGLAITAYHVADGWMNYQQQNYGYKCPDSTFSVAAFQWFEGNIYKWDVDAIYGCQSSDIAFLRFHRPSWWGDGPGLVKPRCARLNFNPPVRGDELRVFGFPYSEIKDDTLTISPTECLVKVKHVDLKGDINFRPLSHIDVEGEILGGMSGGPCFDSDWNVVGVGSKGWDFLDGPPLSYVALLWPAMRVEIDLFKTGGFPAINLFKDGNFRALGYRRLHVTSSGEALLSNVNPDDLVAIQFSASIKNLKGALNFAGSNAQNALAELRIMLDKVLNSAGPLDSNCLHRIIRYYFWELNSVINLAFKIAAVKIGFTIDSPISWNQFIDKCRDCDVGSAALDELAKLGFSWNGVDLFEMRTYAEICVAGVLLIQTALEEDRVICLMLGPCRRNGDQVNLPEGLDRFIDSSRRFVKKLLLFSRRVSNNRQAPSKLNIP